MSSDIRPNTCIRRHSEDSFADVGVMLYVDLAAGSYVWIAFPEKDRHGKRTKHYIKAPQRSSCRDLREALSRGDVTLQPLKFTGWRALTEARLRELAAMPSRKEARLSVATGPVRDDRAKLQRSVEIMDIQWNWIEPLVAKSEIEHLCDVEVVKAFAKLRGRVLRVEPDRIERAVRAYLLGGQCRQALLPCWDKCNVPGKGKLPRQDDSSLETRRAGRKNVATLRGVSDLRGISMAASDREKLRRGWRKHKKQGVSVAAAYHRTLAEFWSADVNVIAGRRRVKLLPAGSLPTIHQFRRHGPGSDPAASASRINLGTHRYARNERPLHGTARDGLVAAAQVAFVDSTPDDQHLVLPVDRTVAMPQSYDTKVVEGYTGYILGVHSGFERSSTLTAMIAVANAAISKAEYCRRFGVEINDDDWIALQSKRIRTDNGELKSEAGIAGMSEAGISAEFVISYAAELKGPVESSHHSVARAAGHQMAGSSRGSARSRGDPDPSKDACLTHSEYMHHFLRAVLRHNNTDPVPHLLTLEMREANVQPTRGAILKWMIEKGYVVSDAIDINNLRAWCLPSLEGVLQRDGVRLFDPRSPRERRIVPHLRYASKELHATGLTAGGRHMRKDVKVHFNPSELGRAWLSYKGMVPLELITHDPELHRLTLLEWLRISDNDKLKAFLEKHAALEVYANDGSAIDATNANGRRTAKEHALRAKERGSQEPRKPSKPEAAAIAAAQEFQRKLGLQSDERDRPTLRLVHSTAVGPSAAEGVVDNNTPNSAEPDDEPSWVQSARAALDGR